MYSVLYLYTVYQVHHITVDDVTRRSDQNEVEDCIQTDLFCSTILSMHVVHALLATGLVMMQVPYTYIHVVNIRSTAADL